MTFTRRSRHLQWRFRKRRQLFAQCEDVLAPVADGIEPGKSAGEHRGFPSAGKPGAVMEHAQGFDQAQLTRLEVRNYSGDIIPKTSLCIMSPDFPHSIIARDLFKQFFQQIAKPAGLRFSGRQKVFPDFFHKNGKLGLILLNTCFFSHSNYLLLNFLFIDTICSFTVRPHPVKGKGFPSFVFM
jgi:hypothetical protein